MIEITFPVTDFTSERWRIASSARSGGQSITGAQKWVTSPAGRWSAHVVVNLRNPAAAVDLEGFIDGLSGPTSPFLIGPQHWSRMPWQPDPDTGEPVTPNVSLDSVVDRSADLNFSMANAYSQQTSTIILHRERGGKLRRGYVFSIGEHMYRIVSEPNDAGGVSNVVVHIRPWLRSDVAEGATVNFKTPTCAMQLADPDQGQIDFSSSPVANVTLDLIEAL